MLSVHNQLITQIKEFPEFLYILLEEDAPAMLIFSPEVINRITIYQAFLHIDDKISLNFVDRNNV